MKISKSLKLHRSNPPSNLLLVRRPSSISNLPPMENNLKRQRTTRVAGRSSKRGRETYAVSIITQITEIEEEETDLVVAISRHVDVLNSSFSDAGDVKGAAAALSSLAKTDENVEMMVENGAIPALVRNLESPWSLAISGNVAKSCDHKLEKDCAVSLGLIAANQPAYQQLIVDAGVLAPTVKLLKRRGVCIGCMEANAVLRRAADIITNIAHDNPRIKTNIRYGLVFDDPYAFFGLGYKLFSLDRVEGGIPPLVELLDFPDVKVQRAAAGALRTVSFRNDENKNQIVELNALPTLVLMLQSEDPSVHGESVDGKLIFIDNSGMEFLLEPLYISSMKQQKYSARALFELATKATSFAPEDSAPSSPTQRAFLGEEFVNNPTLSDVTFLIDGKQFFAHKICLVASSDIFRAMFDGLYKERNAQNVEIPNISWEVFELMMRFIYTGKINITKYLAQDLLVAADQYLLEGLKRLCEYTIAQDICVENIPFMYDLADTFNASALRRACTLFVLEHYTKLSSELWFPMFIKKIIPEIRSYITDILRRPVQASS
ncbi:hypothetical protein BRARA_B00471 [Brassica rapa]|uniref:BTB domain-containing protein n=1 Tax=Brassica campestris TaxID=3711 RepID=A0A398A772_BRACM|nr:hypothetical protein BRARA_B00471 [Brassica rapa]